MTAAKKTVEALAESLKKAKAKASEIRKLLKQTEHAERAKRAISYWSVIHDIAIAKGVDIPTPEQIKKILIKTFKEEAEEKPSRAPKKRATAKRQAVKETDS